MIQTHLEENITATICLDKASQIDERSFVKSLKRTMSDRPAIGRYKEYIMDRFSRVNQTTVLEDADVVDEVNLLKECYDISTEVGLINPFREHRNHIKERYFQLVKFLDGYKSNRREEGIR